MDVLCLYFNNLQKHGPYMCSSYVQHLLSFPHNKSTPRVMFAGVYDWYSVNNPTVNVSSWHLHATHEPKPYGYSDRLALFQDYSSVNETIELKVKFVQRLFSEMSGVRENITRLAVIFIDGHGLSRDDRRLVPDILQQQDTNIKIFSVVMNVKHEVQIVHLKDTLLVDYNATVPQRHLLGLAMCNQCLDGWWKFEHNVGSESVSCYKMLESVNGSNSEETWSTCHDKEDSNVVTIEYENELIFLQTTIDSFFYELSKRPNTSSYLAHFFIGLNRDSDSLARRFRWELFGRSMTRPLVVNNWLPGKPSGGYMNGCAVWEFGWDEKVNDVSNVSRRGFVDGWVDVDCRFVSSFTLCETSMSRRIENFSEVNVNPATNVNITHILNNEAFVIFRDNIVSVSFNVGNKDFLKFLQQIKYELFPLFDCGEDARRPRYISYVLVCNNYNDCSNRRDEEICHVALKEYWEHDDSYCKGIYCCDGSCLLIQWVNDGEVDCPVCDISTGDQFNDESKVLHKYLNENEACAFICNDDKCIHLSQLNDGHIDCTGWEGPLDETIGKLETTDTCHNQTDHITWAPKCVYIRDGHGAALGCRDMSHLKDCMDFECPVGYVKCPSTYCIPQHYVLDEKNDCPTGEDEQIDKIGPCIGNFACWNSKVCLHPDLVCNGYPDCPYKDDEVECNFYCFSSFPDGEYSLKNMDLRCVSGILTTSPNVVYLNPGYYPYWNNGIKYVDLSKIDLSLTSQTSLKRSSLQHVSGDMPLELVVFKCSFCGLTLSHLDIIDNLHFLYDVDLSYNKIEIVDGIYGLLVQSLNIRRLNFSHNTGLKIVRNLKFALLETLDLSHTNLSDLDASFLETIPLLKYLDLSFTLIASFHKTLFSSSLSLETLDLRGLTVDSFHGDFFNGLTISQNLFTDRSEMCCPQVIGNNIPHHVCVAVVDTISSCFNLISDNVQLILLAVIATLSFCGNVVVTVYRLIWDRSSFRTCYGVFVTNLSVSDFIMSVYMFIIIGADYYHRGVYVFYDKTWRGSILCQLAGFLATFSSEASTFCILLISLDRFLVKKFPVNQNKFRKLASMAALLLSWIIAFILALIPELLRFEMNSANAMCIGLPLTTERLKGWEFSFGMFIVLNLLLCFLVVSCERVTVDAKSESEIAQTERGTFQERPKDKVVVAKQRSLFTLLHFLCWFTIGFEGLLSLCGHRISREVASWTMVIVFPIKSTANPILFTIPVLMDKWQRFRYGTTKSK